VPDEDITMEKGERFMEKLKKVEKKSE